METITINRIIESDFQGKEAFKTLRSNIQFCGDDIKVIGITSCIPGEGKSSISSNLAVTLADADNKVIFIDGDLRKSVLIGRYKINKPIKGLSHYLSGINSLPEVIYDSNIKNLKMIFSGPVPPNPTELLSGAKYAKLISMLKDTYDYIVIDTPPLGSVIDSAEIAKHCDGMIMVIESNQISYKLAQRVKEQLDRSGCKVLGAVLNKVQLNDKSYYGKYYGKYYGEFYGKYGEQVKK